MPTLPLYTPNPGHPNASHAVLAPGGYERWYFDAESAASGVRMVAAFSQGWPDHPDHRDYLRRCHSYRTAPTRRAPPVPDELCSISVSVYEPGWAPVRRSRRCMPDEFCAAGDRLHVWAGQDFAAVEPDGSIRVRLGGAEQSGQRAFAVELLFRPLHAHPPRDFGRVSPDPYSSHHHWVLAAPHCAVEGAIDAGNGRVIPFAGHGYHDHHYGTGPLQWFVGGPLRGRVLAEGRVAAFNAAGSARLETSKGRSAEVQWFEADATGAREVATRMWLEGTTVPTLIEIEEAGVKLSGPQFLDGAGPVRRIVYNVSAAASSDLDGRTALCEWA